ncbi:MAG: hypothetical protein K8S21_03505 [Gemmatimonadetes bacterium]|nr:hypothetical protein [Gemmatimonadota bacterium]
MRSPADRRIPWERVARGVALAIVALVLLRTVLAPDAAAVPAVHVDATDDLSAQARDSLVARARAGDAVTWSGEVAAIATVAEPLRDPSARTTILAVSDGALALGDSLGAIDSLPAGGGAITASGLRGPVRVGEGRTGASAAAPMPSTPGRVLVLGRVGWESKFTIAALEEAGWSVDARLRLSDTVRLTQGDARTQALGAQAVVVALDTALGAEASALLRFVRAGGGLVLSGEAAGAPSLAGVAPARPGTRQEGGQGAFDAQEPLQALPLRPLGSLRAESVVLERREGTITVAARRVAAGRVVQAGYDETWRWRMQGGASGARDHREWWSHLVAAASGAPTDGGRGTRAGTGALPVGSLDGSAPRATLVQRLGPAVSVAPPTPPAPRALPAWLGIITLILLVAEWASRRARGAA